MSKMETVWHGATWRQFFSAPSVVTAKRGRPPANLDPMLDVVTDDWQSTKALAVKANYSRQQASRRLRLLVLAGFLEVEIARHPGNVAALAELGHVYTRAGRYEKGLEVDRELVRRRPTDSTARYNLACSFALLGRADEALEALDRAVELGYADVEQLRADEDLASLRGNARFEALVARLQGASKS